MEEIQVGMDQLLVGDRAQQESRGSPGIYIWLFHVNNLVYRNTQRRSLTGSKVRISAGTYQAYAAIRLSFNKHQHTSTQAAEQRGLCAAAIPLLVRLLYTVH